MMKIFKYLNGNKTMRTAPKAEVRYANSRVVPGARYAGAPADKVQQNVLTNIMGGGMLPAHILRYIPINGDTTYVELPEAQSYMFKPTARYERSASFKNPKGLEYNILKRRFNTAWGLAKHQDGTTKGGIKFGGSNKSNRFVSQGKSPEVTVTGTDKRWRFDRRDANLGNGHHVINDVIYDYYNGGNSYLGDLAVVRGGRTIYTGPRGNDTIFFKDPNTLRMVGDHFMQMGPALEGARRNFYNIVRNKPLLPGSPEEKQALMRAKRGN